ncbi:hypothetical protein [Streptomyces griseosporeus]|uniref:hypothetical protein n=1 Tax=Streptomyces griseosporeus TaxID=1910 RepID=UPI003700C80E
MRRPISKRQLLRRIEALEARLEQPTPPPLPGQQTIDLTPRYEQPTHDEDDTPP